MKTIGMIGGMSWKSSAEYYRIMNETIKAKLGGHHSCKCLMYSVNFDEIEKLQFRGQWSKLTQIMVKAAKSLEKGGAQILIICTNTMHLMYSEILDNIYMPGLHITDAVAEAIKIQSVKNVGLLGTRFTMEMDFYSKRLKEKHNIETIVPENKDMDIVHNVIFNELILGELKESSKKAYIEIIEKLVSAGAEGIILGCTEIPLLIKENDVAVPVFDTTSIHAKAAVEMALL